MRNPEWPQHAKFHNAQTMLMGIGLGLTVVGIRGDRGPRVCPASLGVISLARPELGLRPKHSFSLFNSPECSEMSHEDSVAGLPCDAQQIEPLF